MTCDHSPMRATGADYAQACVGCGAIIGKFTVNGKTYTTKAAADDAQNGA